jgi:hypothetical protein
MHQLPQPLLLRTMHPHLQLLWAVLSQHALLCTHAPAENLKKNCCPSPVPWDPGTVCPKVLLKASADGMTGSVEFSCQHYGPLPHK